MRAKKSKGLKIKYLDNEKEFKEKIDFFLKEWDSDSKEVAVRTSGSTGAAKTLSVEKIRMLKSAKRTCDFLGLEEGDSALICLPIEYISGKMMVVRALERGLTLFATSPSLTPLRALNHRVDFCALTPLQAEHSVADLWKVSNILIGGAGVSTMLQGKMQHALSGCKEEVRIYESFGMSETLSHIALKMLYPKKQEYFTLLEGITISTSHEGALTIEAPELTSSTLYTTDRVEIISEGKFRFLGRLDHVINSGGVKIHPEELESFIKEHTERELAVSALPDPLLGQRLVVVVQGKEEPAVRAQILELPFSQRYLRPKEVFFTECLPLTPNGKINRMELARWLENQSVSTKSEKDEK